MREFLKILVDRRSLWSVWFVAARAGAGLVETAGSHPVYVSNPQVVADLIEPAAQVEAK